MRQYGTKPLVVGDGCMGDTLVRIEKFDGAAQESIQATLVFARDRLAGGALSCRDVRDMLAKRGVAVDASTIHRWVRKFGPGIRRWA